MRLVSLCPSNTEIAVALGLGDALVGVDDYSDWPAGLLSGLPRLGPDLNVDLDKVVALRPDLVLASLSVPGMERNVAGLQERGLPHVVLDPHSLTDVQRDLRLAAAAAGVPQRGEAAAEAMAGRLGELQRLAARAAWRPSLYWEWWPKPYIVPGRRNWLTELSNCAGAVNVFGDKGEDSYTPTDAEVLAADPDFILAVWCGVDAHRVPVTRLLQRPGWSGVSAIRTRRVHVLEEGLYCRPSPRLLDGLAALITLLHPELA